MRRTLANCKISSRYGTPHQYEGKCEGIGTSESNDEPCQTCRVCRLNIYWDEDDLKNKVYFFQDPTRDGGLFIAAKTWKEARNISLTGDYDMLANITLPEIEGHILKDRERKPYITEYHGILEGYQLDDLGIEHMTTEG